MAEKCSTTEELPNDDDPITSLSVADIVDNFVPAFALKQEATTDMAVGGSTASAASPSASTASAAVVVEVDCETRTTTTTTTTPSIETTSKPAEIVAMIASDASSSAVTTTTTTTTTITANRRMSHKETGSSSSSSSNSNSSGEDDEEVAAAMDRIQECCELTDNAGDRRASEVTPTSSAVSSNEEYDDDEHDEKVNGFLKTPVANDNHIHASHHHHHHHHHQHQDVVVVVDAAANAENIELLMVVETSVGSAPSKSKQRLSDEFFSADDGSDDGDCEDEASPTVFMGQPKLLQSAIDDEDSHPGTIGPSSHLLQSSNNNTPMSVVDGHQPCPDSSSPHSDSDDSGLRLPNCDFGGDMDLSSSSQHMCPIAMDDDSTPHFPLLPTTMENHIRIADEDLANQGDELTEYFEHDDVQSMDAIERRDIEEEHKITGVGGLMRCRSTMSSTRLHLGVMNPFNKKKYDQMVVNELAAATPIAASSPPAGASKLATTPTSSRTKLLRFGVATKCTASAKINLSESLEKAVLEDAELDSPRTMGPNDKVATEAAEAVSSIVHSIINKLGSVTSVDSIASSSTSTSATTMSAAVRIRLSQQKIDSTSFNFNCSNDSSVSADKSYRQILARGKIEAISEALERGTLNALNGSKTPPPPLKDVGTNDGSGSAAAVDSPSASNTNSNVCSSSNSNNSNSSKTNNYRSNNNNSSGSSNSLSNCSFSTRSEASTNTDVADSAIADPAEPLRKDNAQQVGGEQAEEAEEEAVANANDPSDADRSVNVSSSDDAREVKHSQSALIALENDHDYEDDTWADCEEMSDTEEVCTCRDYSDESSSEDETPARDQPAPKDGSKKLSERRSLVDTTPQSRKRRVTDPSSDDQSNPAIANGDSTPGKRKRLMTDGITSPQQHPGTPSTPSNTISFLHSPSLLASSNSERRTPRSLLIPTRDNPPPELANWLQQFQRWSHAERMMATDHLIEFCEPSQVRHMMKVIEPQFQRDFISLLPKELALQVLTFLDPRDLLRAAQTCHSWRFLCDDNLLWKEKCKYSSVVIEPTTDRPKRGRAGNMPHISSPWKAAYMRQTIIELNWRTRPIRDPKVLKGHDDHVITCLQFCGNRIVSGSDDNTLKVWSAITGKCLRTLVGHTGGVWSSQMAGNCIISGSTDRTLKVWNADTGHCTHTLYGHTSTVRCMHLHGNLVVSGSRDATLRVWDIHQGKCMYILVGHLAAVRCVQYDGKLVVSGAYDYLVKVWVPERQECIHTLQGHTNRVYSLQFDGIHVVSGSLDTSIRVWEAATGTCKHTLMGHQSLTSGMELRQNILVSGNADSTVKVWDIMNGQCLQTLSGPNKHQSAVTCLQFNSRFVITSSDDGTVKLWDVRTGEFIRNLVSLDSGGSGGVVWRIRANDTKLICAVGSRNGTEETKLMVLDFDVEGACLKCS